jgi:hypothetical protein
MSNSSSTHSTAFCNRPKAAAASLALIFLVIEFLQDGRNADALKFNAVTRAAITGEQNQHKRNSADLFRWAKLDGFVL